MELESLIIKSLLSHRLYCEIKKRIPDIHQEIYRQVYQILLREASAGDICNEDQLQKLLVKLSLDNLLKQEIYQLIDIPLINKVVVKMGCMDNNCKCCSASYSVQGP